MDEWQVHPANGKKAGFKGCVKYESVYFFIYFGCPVQLAGS